MASLLSLHSGSGYDVKVSSAREQTPEAEKPLSCCAKIYDFAVVTIGFSCINAPIAALTAWAWPTTAISVSAAVLIINPLFVLGMVTAVVALLALTNVRDPRVKFFALCVTAIIAVMGTFALISAALAISIASVAIFIGKTIPIGLLSGFIYTFLKECFKSCWNSMLSQQQ